MICPWIVLGVLAMQPGFEVASIKSTEALPAGLQVSGGRVSSRAITLTALIAEAYDVNPMLVLDGPEWMGTARFEVEAKVAGMHSRGELLQMMQPLMADRFKLAFHRERREMPVEVLVAGKASPQWKPAAATDVEPSVRLRVASKSAAANRIEVSGRNVTLAYFAKYLTGRLSRVILDQTGLDGAHDFDIETALDPVDASDPSVPERNVIRNMFSDVAEKLGLKLIAKKAVVEVLVIDHAQLPSAN